MACCLVIIGTSSLKCFKTGESADSVFLICSKEAFFSSCAWRLQAFIIIALPTKAKVM
jgi:hypothetical protein